MPSPYRHNASDPALPAPAAGDSPIAVLSDSRAAGISRGEGDNADAEGEDCARDPAADVATHLRLLAGAIDHLELLWDE